MNQGVGIIFFTGLIGVALMACPPAGRPEMTLLSVFKEQLSTLERYDTDYVGYLDHQIRSFPQTNKKTTRAIQAINQKYRALSPGERQAYQRRWQNEFQPVIDAIYRKTRQMVVNAKQNLTPARAALIQELSIKMELLEKNALAARLKPRFFVTPGAEP